MSWATIRLVLNKPIIIPGLSQRKTRKAPSQSAKWFGRIVIGSFILLSMSFTIWRTYLNVQVRSQLKGIAKRGEPVDATALNASYQAVPEQENAAVLWKQGYEQLVPRPKKGFQPPWSKLEVPRRGIGMSNELLSTGETYVASNTIALATFRQAATLSKSRYSVDLSQGLLADMPHLQHLKSAAQLLRLEAVVATESQDTNRAVAAILAIMAAGRSLESEPTLMSMLVRFAIDNIAYQTTEYLLNHAELSDSHLQQLSAAFAQMEDNQALARALAGERAMLVSFLNNPEWVMSCTAEDEINNEGKTSAFAKLVGAALIRFTGFFQRDLRFSLESFNSTIKNARLPDPERFLAR